MSFIEATLLCVLKNPPPDVQPESSPGAGLFRLCSEENKPAGAASAHALCLPLQTPCGNLVQAILQIILLFSRDSSFSVAAIRGELLFFAVLHALAVCTVVEPVAACVVGSICTSFMHADCGVWMLSQDYFGSDVFDRRAESNQECVEQCASTPNCNAVTYDAHVSPAICYMKNLLGGELRDWRPQWPIASYRLCGNESGAPPAVHNPGPGGYYPPCTCGCKFQATWQNCMHGDFPMDCRATEVCQNSFGY